MWEFDKARFCQRLSISGGSMTGLLLLGVVGAWLAFVIFSTRLLARLFKPGPVRNVAVMLAFVAMVLLPVADELITAPQFNRLCEEKAQLKFDPEKIRGRTIFLADDPQPRISVGLLRGYSIQSRYLDAITKEMLVSAPSFHLEGGVLIRTLGISQTNAPLTMRSYCAPKERPWQEQFLSRYNMKYIEEKGIK